MNLNKNNSQLWLFFFMIYNGFKDSKTTVLECLRSSIKETQKIPTDYYDKNSHLGLINEFYKIENDKYATTEEELIMWLFNPKDNKELNQLQPINEREDSEEIDKEALHQEQPDN